MKKVILATVTVAALSATGSANAATATVCAAPTAAANGTAVAGGATDQYVKVGFTPKCSANVHLVSDDQNTFFAAGSASAKGKNAFGGSTAGGGVSALGGTCSSTTICTSSDANRALTTAVAAGTSG